MDVMSVLGIISSVGVILWGIFKGGNPENYYNVTSVAIALGGTLSALMISFPLTVFASLPKTIFRIFFYNSKSIYKIIDEITEIADKVKRRNIIVIEDKIPEYKNLFLQHGLMLAVDCTDSDEIREIMENQLNSVIESHKAEAEFFEKAAFLAPGFGMAGAVVGFINIISNMKDISAITSDMTGALLTVLYSILLANLIFTPLGNKVRQRSADEVLCCKIIIEGIIGIVNNESPKKIRDKLMAFVPGSMRKLPKRKEHENPEDEFEKYID